VIDLVNQSTGKIQLPCASLQRVVLRNFNLEGCNLRGACLKGMWPCAPKTCILHQALHPKTQNALCRIKKMSQCASDQYSHKNRG